MGCSASRLSSTKSGTVKPIFLGAGLSDAGIDGLSLPAPVPPLALLSGKKRIAGLGYGGGEDDLATDINTLAGSTAEFLVELLWILSRELFHVADAEKLKITQHGWADGD